MKRIILYHYIYITTNKINGHNYIGQKTCYKGETPETDGYLGSGKILLEYAIPKYGKENFTKEVLEHCETKKEADILEKKYIAYYKSIGKAEYNVSEGGNGGNLGDKVNKKISQSMNNLHANEKGIEIRKKISAARKSQVFTEESEQRRKESLRAYWQSEEGQKQRKINSERNKSLKQTKGKKWYTNGIKDTLADSCPDGFRPGRTHTATGSEKRSQSRKDWWNSLTDEERQVHTKKIADGHRGIVCSANKKSSISKANKGRKYYNNGEIEVMRFECPEGFVPGRCPKAKASISKGMKSK